MLLRCLRESFTRVSKALITSSLRVLLPPCDCVSNMFMHFDVEIIQFVICLPLMKADCCGETISYAIGVSLFTKILAIVL